MEKRSTSDIFIISLTYYFLPNVSTSNTTFNTTQALAAIAYITILAEVSLKYSLGYPTLSEHWEFVTYVSLILLPFLWPMRSYPAGPSFTATDVYLKIRGDPWICTSNFLRKPIMNQHQQSGEIRDRSPIDRVSGEVWVDREKE